MRFRLKEPAYLALTGHADQVYPAGTIFGDSPGDIPLLPPLPANWPPPFVTGLDDEAKSLVRNANERLVRGIEGQYTVGSIPGLGHANNVLS